MSEWWTYRPSDFLMFSPRVYWRLFESLNAAWWPAQPFLVAAALGWLGLRWRDARGRPEAGLRAAAVFLAACWVLVAWAFMLERFAPVNWPARAYAVLFALQALALLATAIGAGLRSDTGGPRRRAAVALALWALLGHPLLAMVSGRPWQQAEVFGFAPDPTAIGTLAFLLVLRAPSGASRWWFRALWVIPLAWCGVSGLTLATMGSSQAWVLLAAAVLAAAASARR